MNKQRREEMVQQLSEVVMDVPANEACAAASIVAVLCAHIAHMPKDAFLENAGALYDEAAPAGEGLN